MAHTDHKKTHDKTLTACPRCGQPVKKFKMRHHKMVCRGGGRKKKS